MELCDALMELRGAFLKRGRCWLARLARFAAGRRGGLCVSHVYQEISGNKAQKDLELSPRCGRLCCGAARRGPACMD